MINPVEITMDNWTEYFALEPATLDENVYEGEPGGSMTGLYLLPTKADSICYPLDGSIEYAVSIKGVMEGYGHIEDDGSTDVSSWVPRDDSEWESRFYSIYPLEGWYITPIEHDVFQVRAHYEYTYESIELTSISGKVYEITIPDDWWITDADGNELFIVEGKDYEDDNEVYCFYKENQVAGEDKNYSARYATLNGSDIDSLELVDDIRSNVRYSETNGFMHDTRFIDMLEDIHIIEKQ